MVDFDSPRVARAEGLRQRRSVVGEDRVQRETRLCERLVADPVVGEASLIGVFLADDGEPDLAALIDRLRAAGTDLALPVLEDDPQSFAMQFCHWRPDTPIVRGRYGIGVPADGEPCQPDVILVPLVGFDAAGNRVGRGAGFFDRYLATSTAIKVGVGFACQRFDALPVQPHDVPLDAVITEDETLRWAPLRPNKT